MADILATLIITDAFRERAKDLVDSLSARASEMFDTPLSSDGAYPATHWISSGYADSGLLKAVSSPNVLKEV